MVRVKLQFYHSAGTSCYGLGSLGSLSCDVAYTQAEINAFPVPALALSPVSYYSCLYRHQFDE